MRFERKYRIEGRSIAEVQQLVELHPAAFQQQYPARQVNNIYLDTPELHSFHQNIQGHSHRKKYRLRWYGPSLQHISHAQIEIKEKQFELGTKTIYPLESCNLSELPHIASSFQQLPGHLSYILQPILLNAYQRFYYLSHDLNFRLTLDHSMQYHSLLRFPQFETFSVQDAAIILELKYDQQWEEAVYAITRHFPFQISKHSKYVQGVRSTHS